MSSPSALLKVNYLVMRYLHFGSLRGDLLEGHFYDSRCPFPVFQSKKSGFLFFFGLPNPHFQAFRAQNRGFCALFTFGTALFRVFEHKIGIFVRYSTLEPRFSGFSSTIVRFFCAFGLRNWVAATALYLFMVPALGVRPLPWMLMKPICHYSKLLLSRKPEFDWRWQNK